MIEINLFLLTTMFNRILACPPTTMLAEMVSIVGVGGQLDTNRLIKPSRLILLLSGSFNGPYQGS
jgi:hypothetical protein